MYIIRVDQVNERLLQVNQNTHLVYTTSKVERDNNPSPPTYLKRKGQMGKCQVCKQRESVGVFSSVMGPVSVAYCERCLEKCIEPYELVVGALMGIDSEHDLADHIRPVVDATLEFFGKSYVDLFKDVRSAEEEYWNALNQDARRGV